VKHDWINAEQERICDYCGQNKVKIFFKRIEELEEFRRYGSIPYAVASYRNLFRAEDGNVYYLLDLKILVVVCDKCISGHMDPQISDYQAFLVNLSGKPHLIKEAISCMNRNIVNEQKTIEMYEEFLTRYRQIILEGEAGLEKSKKFLAEERHLRENFMRKRTNLNLVRQRLTETLRAALQKKQSAGP
jgi:hypothetical protein